MAGTIGLIDWPVLNESSCGRGSSAHTSQGMAIRGKLFTPNPDILFLILKMVRVFIYKVRTG